MDFTLKHNSWFGGNPVDIRLPEDWNVTEYKMPADSSPALDRAALREVINSPCGTNRIRDLAAGKKEVCIIFDDMSRGTPCEDIAEVILEELHAAGIEKRQIRFICALGSHGTCTREDFVKKLGERIVREYAVFNHNAFQNCDKIGVTSGGVELYYNREVMLCDLKIGIGCITPHPVNGFGGGGKIVAIGVAGIDTIEQLHACSAKTMKENKFMPIDAIGNLKQNGMRHQIEEIVSIIGLDFKVDAILDSDCRIVGCSAGAPNEEYREGVAISTRMNYTDSLPVDMDVVIANANAKANEAAIAFFVSCPLLKKEGGSVVIVDHIPTGQVVHQLAGASGYYTGGREFTGMKPRIPGIKKLIIYTPFPDRASSMYFGDPDWVEFAESWEDVMAMLGEYGAGTKAAVLSDATIMAFPRGQETTF